MTLLEFLQNIFKKPYASPVDFTINEINDAWKNQHDTLTKLWLNSNKTLPGFSEEHDRLSVEQTTLLDEIEGTSE